MCDCVCMHSGVITSCLSWLEIVSLIPLHHMSGFICILCQELMEFCTARSGSLWRHQTWCDVYTAASSIVSDWFVVFFACFMLAFVSLHFVMFFFLPTSNLNGFVDEMACQSLVCLFQELSLHVSASIREYRCFPFVALFFHSEMKRRGNGICSHSVVCVVNNVCCNFLARYNKSKLLHTLFDHVSSVSKLVNILFQ